MNVTRFEAIARYFASSRDRRATLAGPGAMALAQEATPNPAATVFTSTGGDAVETPADAEFLFVQPFANGAWAPKDGVDDTYTLTLTGNLAQTVYFSDRPERIFGQMTTSDFLANLGFTPENPPNAAILAPRADGSGDEILVIELLNPAYDGSTLTYDARVLADYHDSGLAHAARRQDDYTLPETFAEGGLFIDGIDCPVAPAVCYQQINGSDIEVGVVQLQLCSKDGMNCDACPPDFHSSYYGKLCADTFPGQCSYGRTMLDGKPALVWDCFVQDED